MVFLMFAYYKCYILRELTFLKESMLIKQVHQKSVIFATIGISWIVLNWYQPNVCNRCHDLLMMSMYLTDIAIFKIIGSDCHCIISLISKNEAVTLMLNVDLTKKSRKL